jgi:putative nucleotidyltransferase with HDIG domain
MEVIDLIDESTSLATPPEIYCQLDKAINDENSSFDDIERIISVDPALTTHLLKIANSSFYGFKTKIETVNHALTIIGTKQLADLVLASSAMERFPGVSESLVDMKSFWSHSIGCGLVARALADLTGKFENVESLFVAGLLHDIGRLLLLIKAPDELEKAIKASEVSGDPLFEEEKRLLGFDHSEVGAALVKMWGLPQRLEEAVKYHHKPEEAENFPSEAAISSIADSIANSLGLGSSGETNCPSVEVRVWETLGITEPTVLLIIEEKVSLQFEEVTKIFMGKANL